MTSKLALAYRSNLANRWSLASLIKVKANESGSQRLKPIENSSQQLKMPRDAPFPINRCAAMWRGEHGTGSLG